MTAAPPIMSHLRFCNTVPNKYHHQHCDRMRSSGQSHRVARRGKDYISPFAHDPVRSGVLPYTDSVAAPLPNDEHLQTGLFDFLLQTSFTFPDKEFILPKNVIIPSSNSYEFMNLVLDQKQYPPTSTALQTIRLGYRAYASGSYRMLVMNCIGDFAHYNALDIVFDIDSDEVFQSVRIYDSLGRTTPSNIRLSSKKSVVNKSSLAGKYLCCLQSFLVQICFFDKTDTKQVRMLKENPDYILGKAINQECPQQRNGWDCGLFAFGILLHIANNVPVTHDVFSGSNITEFRQGLYTALLPAPGARAARSRRLRPLSPQFVYSFFPKLVGKVPTDSAIGGVAALLSSPGGATAALDTNDDKKDEDLPDVTGGDTTQNNDDAAGEHVLPPGVAANNETNENKDDAANKMNEKKDDDHKEDNDHNDHKDDDHDKEDDGKDDSDDHVLADTDMDDDDDDHVLLADMDNDDDDEDLLNNICRRPIAEDERSVP
jgi:hypothetical protein